MVYLIKKKGGVGGGIICPKTYDSESPSWKRKVLVQ